MFVFLAVFVHGIAKRFFVLDSHSGYRLKEWEGLTFNLATNTFSLAIEGVHCIPAAGFAGICRPFSDISGQSSVHQRTTLFTGMITFKLRSHTDFVLRPEA